MSSRFMPSEWAVVLPRRRTGIFASPYLEPVSVIERETGDELEECVACGQWREGVTPTLDGDVCTDCRQEYGI